MSKRLRETATRYIHLITTDEDGCLHIMRINVTAFENGPNVEAFFDGLVKRREEKIDGDFDDDVFEVFNTAMNYIHTLAELEDNKKKGDASKTASAERSLQMRREDLENYKNFDFPFDWTLADWTSNYHDRDNWMRRLFLTEGKHYYYVSWW